MIKCINLRPATETLVQYDPLWAHYGYIHRSGPGRQLFGGARSGDKSAEYDAKDFSSAQAAADRALATDPNYVPALIYRGRAEMKLAMAKPGSAADWKSVRSWFAKANRLDTENAEPLILYYQSFVAAGERPTDIATKGLLYAMVLAPQDNKLRWMAVRQLLLDGKPDDAKRALAPIAYYPHSESGRDTADQVLTAIESRDSAKAVSLIDKLEHEWEKD